LGEFGDSIFAFEILDFFEMRLSRHVGVSAQAGHDVPEIMPGRGWCKEKYGYTKMGNLEMLLLEMGVIKEV
jgi:hypothetical protein